MDSIVFLEVDNEDVPLVAGAFHAAAVHSGALNGKALLAACADATIVSCFRYTHFSADVLKQLPNLKLLCTRSAGTDHIDLAACRELDILVCNVPEIDSEDRHGLFEATFTSIREFLEGEMPRNSVKA